jgi:hypothetical protein
LAEKLEKPGVLVNPVLFLIVAGLTALFIAALLYQVLGHR